jgi:hypothetical protein
VTTTKSNLLPLIITAGVQPPTDKTPLATPHYTAAKGIRFRYGFPEKIGGWLSILFANGAKIFGVARSIFSTILTTAVDTLIGTNSNLYSLIGSTLTNITPLVPIGSAIPMGSDPLSSFFISLANNPISTINGSFVITVTDTTAFLYSIGDSISISGATAFNGLSTGNINAIHIIHTVPDSTHYTFVLSVPATATGSGGGASVKAASGIIDIQDASVAGLVLGERIKISGATAFGGLTSGQINNEFIVTYVFPLPDVEIVVKSTGMATSSANGGGPSVVYQPEIASGPINVSSGFGYGDGNYGTGLYGTALQSSITGIYPQIWFMDRFGVNAIMTPGNQGGLYSWAGSDTVAPTLITNAPAAINYVFVSNNIIVTFGANGVPNNISTSDQGNMNVWISSSTNQVFIDNINGASQLISHVPIAGVNLIYTAHQTYLFQYIGLPLVWSITLLENNVGIIGPMARVAVAGAAYWMDTNGFWMWAGGNVQPIPSNTTEYSTLLHYVFQNINTGQAYKSFAWYNEEFQEIWFHYPSASSNECDSIARYHIVDQTWVPDTMDRTASEYPNLSLGFPRLISLENIFYQHEQGTNDDTNPLEFSLTSNLRGGSNIMQREYGLPPTEISLLSGFVPDSQQVGNINVEIQAKRFPQSSVLTYDEDYTVTPTTEFITTGIGGRFWQYTISGNELGQSWRAGQWMEYVQPSSKQ